jgi:hypothetical protein
VRSARAAASTIARGEWPAISERAGGVRAAGVVDEDDPDDEDDDVDGDVDGDVDDELDEDDGAGAVIVVVTWRTLVAPQPAATSASGAAATIPSASERRTIASW